MRGGHGRFQSAPFRIRVEQCFVGIQIGGVDPDAFFQASDRLPLGFRVPYGFNLAAVEREARSSKNSSS